ncbi:MAG: sugar phosphate isomerase/epimerase [Thermoprotei archaeon]|nr:MAG: sugar phosphate isomerase/epimerase [Thermoprotei archaeon]
MGEEDWKESRRVRLTVIKSFICFYHTLFMKLAVQEGLVPGDTFLERLVNAEKIGFKGIEVGGRGLKDRVHEIKEALSSSKIGVSTICTGYSGCLLSPDKSERDRAMNDIKLLLEIAREIGAVGLIVVPIFGPPQLPDLTPLLTVRELEEKLLLEELRILAKVAEDNQAYILLEPLNRYETHFLNRLEDALKICREVNSEYVKIMADFFHMNIEEKDIAESLEKALPDLRHIHLADSNRYAPGFGHTDFLKPFKVLAKGGYKYFMALECRIPEPRGENLKRIFSFLNSLILKAAK